MGFLLPVVRVGCLSVLATVRLEEWSPIALRRVDRTRLTGPLAISLRQSFGGFPAAEFVANAV